MTNCKRLSFGQPSSAKRKAGRPQLRWENVVKKDLRENFFRGCKEGAFE